MRAVWGTSIPIARSVTSGRTYGFVIVPWPEAIRPDISRYQRLDGQSPVESSMIEDQARRIADRTARTAREAVEKGSAAAEESARESARGAEQSYLAAADGFRDFNVRLIEMAHTNTLAALDSVREISTARGPSEAASLWSSLAQKQFETLTEQAKELTALAQRIATSSAAPMTRSFGSTFKGTT
jgi:hypothetical protein